MATQARWTGGYVTEAPYLPTYLSAQAPAEMQAVCALAGVHFGPPREGLKLLDLGCGRGVSVLTMAAANPSWTTIGIDYMPAHVGEAREIAEEAGLDNARFLEADIAAIDEAEAARLLPELDVVTMHGVWTWVSDAVREGILRIIRSRLKPGGLVLVSYNALPGWAGDIGVQRLLRELVARLPGPREVAMAEAIDASRRLHAAGAPGLKESVFMRRLAKARPASREAFARYAVHEFLSDHWRPAFPQDVAAAFAEAKLDFVAPAALALQFSGLTLKPEQREALAGLPAGIDPQFLTDVFAHPTLRVDLFVRGRRPADVAGAVGAMPLALRLLPEDGRVRLDTPYGEAELPAPVTAAALAALAQRPHTVGELAALPEMASTTPDELLAVLAGSRVASPVWRVAPPPEGQARARRYNEVLLQRFGVDAIAMGGELAMAAPMLGAGAPCSPLEIAALLMLQRAAAEGQPAPAAETIARGMLVADSTEDAIAWTGRAVEACLAQRLPAWRGLGML